MNDFAKGILEVAKAIRTEGGNVPPETAVRPNDQQVLPHSVVSNTRGYIETIVYQINGTYQKGWYDACAVMIRRLMETLIIEVFEHHNLAHKVKNSNGDFLYLSDLISATLTETSWNLGRNTKRALPKLKDIGDQSAHSRRFNAHRRDIEKVIPFLRTATQELIYLADLK